MGILDRNRSNGGEHAGTTLVAAGTKLVGDITLSDNLHVDGAVEGAIRSQAGVDIGQKGRIEGEIEADRVCVSGRFDGNLSARRLEIVAGGQVEGDVIVDELVIEPGGRFNGSSRIRENEAASTPQPAKAESRSAGNKSGDKGEVSPAASART